MSIVAKQKNTNVESILIGQCVVTPSTHYTLKPCPVEPHRMFAGPVSFNNVLAVAPLGDAFLL